MEGGHTDDDMVHAAYTRHAEDDDLGRRVEKEVRTRRS